MVSWASFNLSVHYPYKLPFCKSPLTRLLFYDPFSFLICIKSSARSALASEWHSFRLSASTMNSCNSLGLNELFCLMRAVHGCLMGLAADSTALWMEHNDGNFLIPSALPSTRHWIMHHWPEFQLNKLLDCLRFLSTSSSSSSLSSPGKSQGLEECTKDSRRCSPPPTSDFNHLANFSSAEFIHRFCR